MLPTSPSATARPRRALAWAAAGLALSALATVQAATSSEWWDGARSLSWLRPDEDAADSELGEPTTLGAASSGELDQDGGPVPDADALDEATLAERLAAGSDDDDSAAGGDPADDGDDGGEPEPEPAEAYRSAAPRTHAGPYNEYRRGERYLLYSPNGGFNNQREELESAVQMAVVLNRTLYVPMAGKHSQFWRAYDLMRGDSLFPMDRILDFGTLRTYRDARLVALNVSVSTLAARFARDHGASSVRKLSGFATWHQADVARLRDDRHALLFFRGAGMFHRWFTTETMVNIKKHVRYAPFLRRLAVDIAREYFGGPYYAVHVRMGDYAPRQFSTSAVFVRKARSRGWKTRRYGVYVATEPHRNADYFRPLVDAFNVTFSSDLPRAKLRAFLDVFPPGQLRQDMLGLFEQLVCAAAHDFIGTSFSTFSAWIEFMRTTSRFSFPEIYRAREADVAGGVADAGDAAGERAAPR